MRKKCPKGKKWSKKEKTCVIIRDVMGSPYTRTGNTYEDYAMQHGATPTKKEARQYKRKVKKGKI
jgi:hypothetical protein